MQELVWGHENEVGIEDIDLQHHYFLNLVGHIITALESGEEKNYIEALVNELDAYAKFHFRSEERMMLHSGYPDYEVHKNHHLDLIQQLGIKQYNLIDAETPEDAGAVIEFLVNWFMEHTMGEDKAFADYLLSSQKP
jgi:hemerythrin